MKRGRSRRFHLPVFLAGAMAFGAGGTSSDAATKGVHVNFNVLSKCRVIGGKPVNAGELAEGASSVAVVKVDCSNNIPYSVSVAVDRSPGPQASQAPFSDGSVAHAAAQAVRDLDVSRSVSASANGSAVSSLGRGKPVDIKISGKQALADAQELEGDSDVVRVTVTY